jgi:hypothetical protein
LVAQLNWQLNPMEEIPPPAPPFIVDRSVLKQAIAVFPKRSLALNDFFFHIDIFLKNKITI